MNTGSSPVLRSQLRGEGVLEIFSRRCLAPAILHCLAKDLFVLVSLGEKILLPNRLLFLG